MLHPINWSLALPYYAGAFLFGYLLGSIPFGLILTRLAGTQDLRTIGSGNIGATNVLRTGRKGLAAATLLSDMLKGTVAVLVAKQCGGQDLGVLAALGAFLGHLFPVWLKFKGGKGVATYIGLLLALAWPAAIVFCLVWLAVAALTRYSSLAALTASVVTPAFLWYERDLQEA
ncbi:MAG TPA: glycerol-3-phosphate 1-O-acyltransferase PlsY, partial [Xanthobacteraceae bacterium]